MYGQYVVAFIDEMFGGQWFPELWIICRNKNSKLCANRVDVAHVRTTPGTRHVVKKSLVRPPVRTEMEKSEVELELLFIEYLSERLQSKLRLAANIRKADGYTKSKLSNL